MAEQSTIAFLIRGLLTRVFKLAAFMVAVMIVSLYLFSSNLGIFTSNEFGTREANVSIEMPYEEMSKKIRQAIENYFKINLGRPEILNRIGENIVVYDYAIKNNKNVKIY